MFKVSLLGCCGGDAAKQLHSVLMWVFFPLSVPHPAHTGLPPTGHSNSGVFSLLSDDPTCSQFLDYDLHHLLDASLQFKILTFICIWMKDCRIIGPVDGSGCTVLHRPVTSSSGKRRTRRCQMFFTLSSCVLYNERHPGQSEDRCSWFVEKK